MGPLWRAYTELPRISLPFRCFLFALILLHPLVKPSAFRRWPTETAEDCTGCADSGTYRLRAGRNGNLQ